jgi:hypothetical protein
MDWLLTALVLAVLLGMMWFAYHLEPHWASKDGRRCMCSGQTLSARGVPEGRWREIRVMVGEGGHVQVDQRRLMRRQSTMWTIAAESPTPPKRRVLFLLSGQSSDGLPEMMAVRLPTNSRTIPVLRAALQH